MLLLGSMPNQSQNFFLITLGSSNTFFLHGVFKICWRPFSWFNNSSWLFLMSLHEQPNHLANCVNTFTIILCLLVDLLSKFNNKMVLNMFRVNKTPKWSQWRHFDVFNVKFEYISHLFLGFLLLTLNRLMVARYGLISVIFLPAGVFL